MLKPENLCIIDPNAIKIIVCTACNSVVVQDLGRPVDTVLIEMAIRTHLNHPFPQGINHELVTTFIETATCIPGICLDNCGLSKVM